VEVSRPVLVGVVLLVAVLLGPWLARVAVRLAARDDAAVPSAARIGVMTALLAGLLAGSVELSGLRPATAALAWAAGAAVVLGAVDLAVHRLPDRVTYPAAAVCVAAFLVDAVVLGSWGALARARAAGAAAFAVATAVRVLAPDGFGFGDVKLLGLLGLVLGWFGWGVLMAGVFLGLLTGAMVSLGLLATRRVGWRTAIPFGPPLLVGAVLVLALGSVSST
jgi:leader peptidase (prepilin peptidase) / N-methyltransferase